METNLPRNKKELIILIKSIFNMETKNNFRTSQRKTRHTKQNYEERNVKSRNFILASYRVLVSFLFLFLSLKILRSVVVAVVGVLHLSFSFKKFLKQEFTSKPKCSKPEFIIRNEKKV